MITNGNGHFDFDANYQLFVENVNDLICIVGSNYDYKIEYVNQHAFFDILGYKFKKLDGKSILNYIHADDIRKTVKILKKITESKFVSQEIRFKSINNKYVWFEIKAKIFSNKDRQKKLLLILKDISDRKELENKIRENEEKMKDLTNAIPEIRFWKLFYPKKFEEALKTSYEMLQLVIENIPQYIFWKDTNLVYLGCNKNYAELIGAETPERIIGKSDSKLLWDTQKIKELREKEIYVMNSDNGELHKIESWTLKNGEKILLDTNRIPLHDSEGKIVGVLVTYENVTEKKIAEQKLKESEEKYRLISENANDMIAILNQKFEYEYINEEITAKIMGYKNEDVIGKSSLSLVHPDDVTKAAKNLKNVFESGEGMDIVRFKHKNGHWVWLEAKGRTFIDKDGAMKVIVISRDISSRILADQKIKRSERKYRFLFENAPFSIILFNSDGVIVDSNPTTQRLFGYTKQELIGRHFENILIIHPNYLPIFSRLFEGSPKERELNPIDIQLYKKDMKLIWANLRFSLVNIGDRSFIQGIIVDITERKEAEQKREESEKKYLDLLETSSVGILEVDLIKKDLTYINPKLLDILGYERKEITSESFLAKIAHPEDFKKFFSTSDEKKLEFRIYDKEGRLKWLSGNRINHYDEKGELKSFRLWLEDVTEKKIYENLIYELNVNFLNFTTDIQKNIELLIDSCCKLLNAEVVLYAHKSRFEGKEQYQIISSDKKVFIYGTEEFNNNHFISELFNEDHDYIQCISDLDETKFAKKDPYILVYKAKGCYGKLISSLNEFNSALCVFFSENPTLSDQNKLVLFLIADAIGIEQRRWQVQQHLEDQNRLKAELFSRTSHELKTPLISIKGFTELLLTVHRSKFDTDTILILEEINKGSERLEKIVSSLLESSKLDQDQLKLKKTEEDLSFLINFCIQELRGLAELRNQTIELNIHDELITRFDKERMYEAMSNILVNAIKYTPPEGKIRVRSEINEKDNIYIIAVEDNGIGLTEKEKDLIFKPFGKIERYGKGWDVDIEGSGLGLYISKKIIKLHGGKIWVESEGRDKGSIFYFSLPIISK